jgi:hypothetical protein
VLYNFHGIFNVDNFMIVFKLIMLLIKFIYDDNTDYSITVADGTNLLSLYPLTIFFRTQDTLLPRKCYVKSA